MSVNHGAVPTPTGVPATAPNFGQFRSGLPVTLDDRMRPRSIRNADPVTGVVTGMFDAGSNLVTITDADGREHTLSHHWIVPTPADWPDLSVWHVRVLAAQRDRDTPPLFGGDEPKTPRRATPHP